MYNISNYDVTLVLEPYNSPSGASVLALSTLSLFSAVVLSLYSKFV